MTRTKAIARRLQARRDRREFERALHDASPSMQRELRAIATRNGFML